jgi:hypothetical protein
VYSKLRKVKGNILREYGIEVGNSSQNRLT